MIYLSNDQSYWRNDGLFISNARTFVTIEHIPGINSKHVFPQYLIDQEQFLFLMCLEN